MQTRPTAPRSDSPNTEYYEASVGGQTCTKSVAFNRIAKDPRPNFGVEGLSVCIG